MRLGGVWRASELQGMCSEGGREKLELKKALLFIKTFMNSRTQSEKHFFTQNHQNKTDQ